MTKSQALPAASQCTSTAKQIVVYTTFVETESHSFRELVQKLTGVSEGEKLPVTMHARNPSKGRVESGNKSDGSCSPLIKSGIEVGIPPQKSAFKLHQRRQFHKRLEIKSGLCHDAENAIRLAGNNYVPSSPTLIPSPITPLGRADLSTSSSSYCYSSTPTSYNQSSCWEEDGFCFEGSARSVKREPELLPLFPLHSPTTPNN